jgi:hypothetical protein
MSMIASLPDLAQIATFWLLVSVPGLTFVWLLHRFTLPRAVQPVPARVSFPAQPATGTMAAANDRGQDSHGRRAA